jgi:DNA-binding transcriptional LysR family regulator
MDPDALIALPCGIWVRDTNTHRPWKLGDREIAPPPALAVNDYAHLKRRAIEGDIVTELPPFLAKDALRTKQLVALLPDYLLPEQEVNLLYQRQRQPSRIIRAYLDYCARQAHEHLV